MKKLFNKSFWIGFVSGILFVIISLIAIGLCNYFCNPERYICTWDDPEAEYMDTLAFDDLYMGMTEEEFYEEMKKGVNGDLTQEQVDSIQLDLALFNHGVPDSIIKIWGTLSDKQRLDAIMGTATEDIKLWRRMSTPKATDNGRDHGDSPSPF